MYALLAAVLTAGLACGDHAPAFLVEEVRDPMQEEIIHISTCIAQSGLVDLISSYTIAPTLCAKGIVAPWNSSIPNMDRIRFQAATPPLLRSLLLP